MSGWQPSQYDPCQRPPQQAWPPRQQPQAPAGQWAPPLQPRRPATGGAPARRRRVPYPSRLTRFPWALIPGARRRRGPSIWRLVWLGTHPVAALISLIISMYALMLVASWILLVALGWALWCGIVTIGWACGGFQGTPQRR